MIAHGQRLLSRTQLGLGSFILLFFVSAPAFGAGRGLEVGRLFSSEAANAATPVPSASPSPTATPAEAIVKDPKDTQAELNALMKHPAEQNSDRLRPLSGRWVQCQSGVQNKLSSSDKTHFTRTLAKASDADCKTLTSETRTSYECEGMSKTTLTCRATKLETGSGDGNFVTAKSEADLAGTTLKMTLKPLKTKSGDPRRLEVHLTPDSGEDSGDNETLELTFAPKIKKPSK